MEFNALLPPISVDFGERVINGIAVLGTFFEK